MKDYYKIGEISKIYGVGRDSLMYYEEIGIIKPLRDKNGYRMYSIYDIWRLNLLKELKNLNFPIKKIKEYLDDRTVESTTSLLEKEIDIIENKISDLLHQKENLKKRIESINEATNSKLYNMQVKYIKKRKAIRINEDIEKDEDFDIVVQKLQKEYEDRFNILGNNNIGSSWSIESINRGAFNEFKSVFCLLGDEEEVYNIIVDEGYYLTMTYKGTYENNKIHVHEMFKYIEENNYQINGEPIEIYKIDIHETGVIEEFITEIQIPVTK